MVHACSEPRSTKALPIAQIDESESAGDAGDILEAKQGDAPSPEVHCACAGLKHAVCAALGEGKFQFSGLTLGSETFCKLHKSHHLPTPSD